MTTPLRPRSKQGRPRATTVVGACLLVTVQAPLASLTLAQLMPHSGPHEIDATSESTLLSKLGIGWSLLALVITIPLVTRRALRTWWYAPPLTMLVALTVRLLLFPPYGG